jgi:hypothetical protein
VIIAYVDESARHQDNGDSCVYVLAATLVDERHADALQGVVMKHRPRGVAKLHWRDQNPKQMTALTKDLAAVPLTGVVAVHFYSYRPDNERARGLCFNRLLTELAAEHNVGAVVLESRDVHRDKNDRGRLTVLRKANRVPKDMEVTWVRGRDQPLLWAADAVAGAVTWSFGGTDAERAYLEYYGDAVTWLEA